jgi:hypothetical protein
MEHGNFANQPPVSVAFAGMKVSRSADSGLGEAGACGGCQIERPLRLWRFNLRRRVQAKFLAHVSEFPGIGKTPVAHHFA